MATKIKAEMLKRGIEEKRLTREEAAEQIGISVAMLAHITKSGTCGAINLGKIAKFLGVPVWELVA